MAIVQRVQQQTVLRVVVAPTDVVTIHIVLTLPTLYPQTVLEAVAVEVDKLEICRLVGLQLVQLSHIHLQKFELLHRYVKM